jgi:glycosyltransferase involved in cell wall biosynthesis
MALEPRRLKVRTGRGYPYAFDVLLGQRNATFVTGSITPHTNERIARRVPFLFRLQGVALIEPGYDLVHVKNAIPVAHNAPYVITFEDFLPRVPTDYYSPWLHRALFRALASPRCRRIIAESEYAVRQFGAQNAAMPAFASVRAKLEVLRPAIARRAERPKARAGARPKLLFVGRDFIRKGGGAVVRAHEALKRAGLDPETIVVSGMRWNADDYVGPPDADYVTREIARLGASDIVQRGKLPPDEVARLMREADFLLLPTFHDTFGYVTLEAMASGTPVIATNTCALPEVIDDGVDGWLLPFENDQTVGRWTWLYRNADPGYLEAFDSTVERLGAAIANRVMRAMEPGFDYAAMSAAALAKIDSRFDITRARDRLEAIYAAATGR